MKAVILAGGKGARLAPFTTVFPKPLMPLGETPILEIILRQLQRAGFTEVVLAVGYLEALIRSYFGDGRKWGLKIAYSKEAKPLGTAGPLSLIRGLRRTFLVMNGDVLTTLPLGRMLAFHREQKAAATVAVSHRVQPVNYGVIRFDRAKAVTDYIEKPRLDYDVSMGIYFLEPSVRKHIRAGEPLDLPELVRRLLRAGEKVAAYVSRDYWLDIGRHDDYAKAQAEYEKIKGRLLRR